MVRFARRWIPRREAATKKRIRWIRPTFAKQRGRWQTALPVAAYHVSGEDAMLKAAAQNGWLNYEASLLETLLGLRRAGADLIFTYGALEAAQLLERAPR